MAAGRKTGGRKKGTPNRLTFQIRLQLLNALESKIENIPVDLEAMEPKDRVQSLIKLLPYLIPKVLPAHAHEADQKGLIPSEEVVEAFQAKNDQDRIREQIIRSLSI